MEISRDNSPLPTVTVSVGLGAAVQDTGEAQAAATLLVEQSPQGGPINLSEVLDPPEEGTDKKSEILSELVHSSEGQSESYSENHAADSYLRNAAVAAAQPAELLTNKANNINVNDRDNIKFAEKFSDSAMPTDINKGSTVTVPIATVSTKKVSIKSIPELVKFSSRNGGPAPATNPLNTVNLWGDRSFFSIVMSPTELIWGIFEETQTQYLNLL